MKEVKWRLDTLYISMGLPVHKSTYKRFEICCSAQNFNFEHKISDVKQ